MVISVNEIIDSSINCNNNSDELFAEHFVFTEGGKISDFFAAIKKFIHKIIEAITNFITKKKKPTASFDNFPITDDEMKKIIVRVEKYKKFENIFEKGPDFKVLFDDMQFPDKILKDAKNLRTEEDVLDFITKNTDDIRDWVAASMEPFKDFYKNSSANNISELREIVKYEYFNLQSEPDVKINMELYKKAKSDFKLYEKFSNDIAPAISIKTELSNLEDDLNLISLQKDDGTISEKTMNQFIRLIQFTADGVGSRCAAALAILTVKTECQEVIAHQSEYIINKVKKEVLKLRGFPQVEGVKTFEYEKFKPHRVNMPPYPDSDDYKVKPKQESSIYSNLKLI